MTTHPFKGFLEIKHENRGSLHGSGLLARGVYLAFGSVGLLHGLSFNQDGGVNFNVYKSVATTLALFFLWCISNWCPMSLYDGEG